ncbi:MAG: kinase-like domain-containing protein [Linnemannia elongata]|nr:MAG: kinase-like domain-containing protein [Linnemannia elongata]
MYIVSNARHTKFKGTDRDREQTNNRYYFEDEDKAAIGEGSHGRVFRVTNRDGHEFALKVNTDDDTEQWKIKKDVLKATNHRHVVSLHDAFEYGGVAYLTLEEYMARSGRLPESEVRVFGQALVMGVRHLHSRGFLHRDLKPENILLGKDLTLKVADFGLALDFYKEKRRGIFGTYGFIAPELARMEDHTPNMDVWGVGALIYFMLYGDIPRLDEAVKPSVSVTPSSQVPTSICFSLPLISQ